MSVKLSPLAKAEGFAKDLGINLYEGTQGMGRVGVSLSAFDDHNTVASHITDDYGADYYAARIDYRRKDMLKGSRAVVVVMAGYHTKFAYWPDGAETKKIFVHQGHGHLIVGDPKASEDEFGDLFGTKYYSIDAAVTPYITLPPGNFYTFEAASDSPLIVSALSETDAQGQWGSIEIPVEPGHPQIKAPEGTIPVPEAFITAQFD